MENKENPLNEKFFDKIFFEGTPKEYNFIYNKLGYRDRRVLYNLLKFGAEGKNCLDIGPGTGRWVQFLKEQKANYIEVVDLSSESLSKCREFSDHIQKANVEFDKIESPDNFFEVILCFMVLEHLIEPDNLLEEIYRVAKQNSLILFTIPNITSFISRIRMLLGYLPLAVSSDITHIKFYTERELKKLFSNFKMKVEVIPTSFSINPINSKTLRIPSNKVTKSLDDHLLFRVYKV